ncbi:MAG: tRNA (guanosine(37)-N1)-methyltransferase TrmD [bacterium]|nr:tRNA (guanosine(37)-N1)-methyltransferase TrmD [bacterium]
MQFDIITIFPELFDTFKTTSVIKHAINKQVITINIHNLRDYTDEKHNKVDDTSYGGGVGMILMAQPIINAVKSIQLPNKKCHVILLSPSTNFFNQEKAKKFEQNFDQIILICGRYEGVDERVKQTVVDETISIGEYVLTGGELASMVIVDTTSRMVKGFFEKDNVLENESYINGKYIEYPQYTKPEIVEEISVPKVLISGNHQEILKWKETNKIKYTN